MNVDLSKKMIYLLPVWKKNHEEIMLSDVKKFFPEKILKQTFSILCFFVIIKPFLYRIFKLIENPFEEIKNDDNFV